ncbi:MAG: peptide-methionine (S)-S-oxide reductase MsrA [Vibrio metschnikovii]|nr:peptide-methionine (S)-S-oxide reductase MsrA [Vibrio metschnikovii]MDM7484273.1 peptide-methionine (S)-S-oxide reductase MsrA [Vibrio metschnikovii]
MLNKSSLISADQALPGRTTPIEFEDKHFIHHTPLSSKPSAGQEQLLIGMGCFWGAERLFWCLDGVVSTSVGYAGGFTPNPTYQEVCTGKTGHAEVVRVIYDPKVLPLRTLLQAFWENHDPTQGMRQGNDLGTQYRSVIYTYTDEQQTLAEQSRAEYQALLSEHHKAEITTEITPAGDYYFAESSHQQYLAKNPQGYCGLGGTGVCFL